MYKFKVGDVVRVYRPDDVRSGPGYLDSMNKYCGVKAKITKLESGGKGDGWYLLDVDGGCFLWSDLWMKKVVAFKGNK